MSLDNNVSSLESRYLDSCKRHQALPNTAVVSWLHKAVIQRINHQKCTIEVFLDQLEDCDLSPVTDVFLDVQCDAVDILCRSPSVLNQESILSLINAANSKLEVIDFQDASVRKDILCDILHGGLKCHVMNLRFNEFHAFNFAGGFMLLHTLSLDFCSSLSTLENDCFVNMPNLMRISLCGTRVANLWTTSAALSRLNSLVEIRFQNCACCKNTGSCPTLSRERRDLACDRNVAEHTSEHSKCQQTTISVGNVESSIQDESPKFVSVGDSLVNIHTHSISHNSIDDRLIGKMSYNLHGISSSGRSSNAHPVSVGLSMLQIEVSHAKLETEEDGESPTSVLDLDVKDSSIASKMKVLENPSPICFENHYREYMIASLPHLQVLDNIPIRLVDRDMAKMVFSKYFEYLPYKRQHGESVSNILYMRETGTSCGYHERSTIKKQSSSQKSKFFYTRSICAAKFGSSVWPVHLPMSQICSTLGEGSRSLRPRQFEYHPSDASLMGFGTLDGEVVVINHDKGSLFKYIPALETSNSAMALCWLNQHPAKLLAGFEKGSLRLYDINQVTTKVEDSRWTSSTKFYDDFDQLTSVHVNSSDDKFLASGYSRKLAVYDLCTGRRLQLLTDIHRETINVAKFANCSPHLLVTSSYDCDVKMWDLRQKPTLPCYTSSSSRGNVMVCFSPDDLYLLVSAVDNEVRQLLAVDGRLHTRFEISSTGSSHNFTRSYYMNGRDYIISGSSDESILRICCAQTGRRLRDVHLQDRTLGSSMYVQSLRSDPFRHFHMAVLAAYVRPSSRWGIVKVNLLASSHHAKQDSESQDFCPRFGWGG
ncbi:uncharacterized protein LOC113753729 isoform X1 [Coffea eugenioides]|uniref:uncharacterized protein LOC113753729 isoform X1 n=1 Tax=Coffea eugenioides TaxID=49369 RepID=UPI000F613EDA|nr:uncharacterized protein LOC113753729 isoform X1 [Coffea eugenioides]